MKWARSLTKLAGHEVETLQKRLAEVAGRRIDAELRRTLLDAEAEGELENARADPLSAMHHPQFMKGWRVRRDQADARVAELLKEEAGARDALARAFEEQKKYEHVLELAEQARVRTAAKVETAALDELGLRRKAG